MTLFISELLCKHAAQRVCKIVVKSKTREPYCLNSYSFSATSYLWALSSCPTFLHFYSFLTTIMRHTSQGVARIKYRWSICYLIFICNLFWYLCCQGLKENTLIFGSFLSKTPSFAIWGRCFYPLSPWHPPPPLPSCIVLLVPLNQASWGWKLSIFSSSLLQCLAYSSYFTNNY